MFRTAFPPPAALCNGRDKAYLLFFNGFLQYSGEALTCQEEIALFFPLRYNERVLHYAADRLHHGFLAGRYRVKRSGGRRFPAAIGSSGSATNRCKALHKRRGTYGTPSDDGVPKVPLKSLYLWYSDFASVQLFASISGTKPLAPT